MKRNTGVILLVTALSLTLLTPCGLWGESKSASTPSALTIGTSSVGSTYYIMTVGMANLLTKKVGINSTAEAVGGSDANVRALKDKKIDLAMLNANAVSSSYMGIGQFAKAGKLPLRVLFQGQESLRYMIVRKASGITNPAELRGKKFIGKRRAALDVEMVTYAALKAYNVPKDSVNILETAETNEALEAMKTGAVDGILIQAAVRASNLMELARDIDLIFISFPDDKLQAMLHDLGPAFHKEVVPAGTYKGQDQKVQLPSLLTCMTTRAELPDDLAYTITKTLIGSPEALQAMHSVGKEWNMENTLKNPPAPFHPGAIKFFKEKGVWSANMEKVQQQIVKLGGT